MITIALNIKECSDVDFLLRKQQDYSYAFRKLYSNYHKNENKDYCNLLQKKYNLTDIEFRSYNQMLPLSLLRQQQIRLTKNNVL